MSMHCSILDLCRQIEQSTAAVKQSCGQAGQHICTLHKHASSARGEHLVYKT